MALSKIDVFCTNCNSKFSKTPKRSFLGFQNIVCPTCQEKLTYPLTKGYRIIYIILALLMTFRIIQTIIEGTFISNYILGVLITIAILITLFKDRNIRKSLSNKKY